MIPETAYLQPILTGFDSASRLLRAEPPASGLVNRVLVLETTCGDFVLKIFDDQVGHWKPQKEQAINAHMQSLGIPAPIVRLIDTSRSIVPFIYSLTDRVPGTTYSHVFDSFTQEENIGIYAVLGDYLSRLHSTTFDRFGAVYPGFDALRVGPFNEPAEGGRRPGPFTTWATTHDQIVQTNLTIMRGTGFDDLIDPVQEYFERNRDMIDYAIQPRLLHMDFHRGNILIADGAVSGILDVEESIVGHNEFDLMRTELAHFRGQPDVYEESFKRAYAIHVSLDEGYASRQPFYDVSRSLVWIRSLLRYGDSSIRGQSDQSHDVARTHVWQLIDGN